MPNDIFTSIIQWFNDGHVVITIVGFIASIVAIVGVPVLLVQLIELIKRKRSKKSQTIRQDSGITKFSTNFTAQLGNSQNSGFLLKEQRLAELEKETNPYVCGTALPGNSAVFYGRGRELGGILAVLNNKDKPGNISILGERRIGKSSLLNQVYQSLAAKPKTVTIHTTMQNWTVDSQASFFAQLQQSICNALKVGSNPVDNYTGFRDFIQDYAAQGYRFVLIIDEFDRMTDNPFFDAQFFTNMRALGERDNYQFAYLLASYTPLSDICHQGGIQESKFWNIFGTCYTLGLLDRKESENLVQEPMQYSLGNKFDNIEEVFAFTGYHPAFIQIVASEYWNASFFNSTPNLDNIKFTLGQHYQDLWDHRTNAEQKLLRQIARNKVVKDNAMLMNLRLRGIVDADNKLFSQAFLEVIGQS